MMFHEFNAAVEGTMMRMLDHLRIVQDAHWQWQSWRSLDLKSATYHHYLHTKYIPRGERILSAK